MRKTWCALWAGAVILAGCAAPSRQAAPPAPSNPLGKTSKAGPTSAAAHGAPASSGPGLASFLPASGLYTFADGTVERWVLTRKGRGMTLAQYDSGPGPSPHPTNILDLVVQNGCLVQKDIRMWKSGPVGEHFPWYCWPAKSFTDSYDNADYHVTEKATESYTTTAALGRVLHVHVVRQDGPNTETVDRYFVAGKGLAEERIGGPHSGGYDLRPVLPAFQNRPLFKTLTLTPFGAHPVEMPFRLLVAPFRLPFSTYVPAMSKAYSMYYSARTETVGAAKGLLFGDLKDHQQITEVMFLPKGTGEAAALANMRQAEGAFSKAPYSLTTWRRRVAPVYQAGQPHWILAQDTGSNPHHAVDLGGASLGRYHGRFFYIIGTAWYEQAGVPLYKQWRWADGKSFYGF